MILQGKHQLTRLIICHEHLRLLHAGPMLLTASLNQRFYIIGVNRYVQSITLGCIVCRREAAKPQLQKMGKLPAERITPTYPGNVFATVGVDYAGPVKIKCSSVRKPTILKACICVFISMSVKAVHIEAVSDLTTEAFLACLRRFMAQRGKPKVVWSDHGTNFTGAARELKELTEFLQERKNHEVIADFCSSQAVECSTKCCT